MERGDRHGHEHAGHESGFRVPASLLLVVDSAAWTSIGGDNIIVSDPSDCPVAITSPLPGDAG